MTQDEVAAVALVDTLFWAFVTVVAVAMLITAFFLLWGIADNAKKIAKALERMERALAADAKNSDRVLRNIDANVATSAIVLQDIRDGNQDA